MLAYRKRYKVGDYMGKKEKILRCNIDGIERGSRITEFFLPCLDCMKHPSRIHNCFENIERKLGIKYYDLYEHWCSPKPTNTEMLIGACATNPDLGGFSGNPVRWVCKGDPNHILEKNCPNWHNLVGLDVPQKTQQIRYEGPELNPPMYGE